MTSLPASPHPLATKALLGVELAHCRLINRAENNVMVNSLPDLRLLSVRDVKRVFWMAIFSQTQNHQ